MNLCRKLNLGAKMNNLHARKIYQLDRAAMLRSLGDFAFGALAGIGFAVMLFLGVPK